METLKYEYDETPDSVIRERMGEDRGNGVETHGDSRGKGILLSTDHLITVLDALRAGAGDIAEFGHEFTNDCEALRADILAALGIEEA